MIRRLFLFVAIASLGACEADLPLYLAKQGFKQGAMLLRAEPIEELLKDPHLGPETERYLRLSQDVLAFADKELGMKTRKNYRHFIALNRPWVTQVVMAAKTETLEPHLFSYPIFGKLPYKGFFDEADAKELEASLKAQGLDTYRREVEAFSTTGWLPDPLISTMFDNESRFIELLLHELTHATFYFSSEADFNEAFASWMGFKAALEFIAKSPRFATDREAVAKSLAEQHERQIKVAGLFVGIKKRGKEFYAEPGAAGRRNEYFDWVRAQFKQAGVERLAKVEWNNALILSFGTYYELVPAIDRYAQVNALTPRQMLTKVAETGPSIIQEIEKMDGTIRPAGALNSPGR